MDKTEITPEDITPQFNNETEKELFSQAQDGLAADSFLNSATGRMVIDRSQEEVDKISLELINAKIEDVKDLQMKAKIAVQALAWIADVVAKGEMAHQQLKEMNDGK